jgi:hypothetical protein
MTIILEEEVMLSADEPTVIGFIIPGKNPGTVDASSGLIVKAVSPFVGAGPLGCAPSA